MPGSSKVDDKTEEVTVHAFDNGAAQAQAAEWKRNLIAAGELPEPKEEADEEES